MPVTMRRFLPLVLPLLCSHQPVSLRRTEGEVRLRLKSTPPPAINAKPLPVTLTSAQRSRGVIATDQGVHKRRVSLVARSESTGPNV